MDMENVYLQWPDVNCEAVNDTHTRVPHLNTTQVCLTGTYVNPLPVHYKVIATLLYAAIFCWGVFGNILVIDVVRKTPMLHRATYCYLASYEA